MELCNRKSVNFFLILFSIFTATFTLNKQVVIGRSEENLRRQILYLSRSGHLPEALNHYTQFQISHGGHDLDLLRGLALMVLEQGAASEEPMIQLMTLFGAGISNNSQSVDILENGIKSSHPEHQLIALNMLSRFQDDRADSALQQALRSDFLIIRLEAACHLCEKKHPRAIAYLDSLLYKTPPPLMPIYPQLFADIGSPAAIRMVKKFMHDSRADTRISAIMAAASHGRDDLLPEIRSLASHTDIGQLEACAYALGALQDHSAIPILQKLTQSKSANVQVAAHYALFLLGQKEAFQTLIHFANRGNLFALSLLGNSEEGRDCLASISNKEDTTWRVNAALGLLKLKDPRCLKPLIDFFIRDPRDLAFVKSASPGSSLSHWKVIPSAAQNLKQLPAIRELSLKIREQALIEAMELKNEHFLQLAELIIQVEQNDLIPLLVKALENIRTEGAIEILKKYSQKAGAPLIRHYCNLALYRLQEEGPYFENLQQWVKTQQHIDLGQLRPLVPLQLRERKMRYQLTPLETSRLLIESYESFLSTQDDRGIDVLVDSMLNGHPHNKYILAGLLIRATE